MDPLPAVPPELSIPSWTGCYLTYQVIKLGMHSHTALSDGSEIYVIRLKQALKAQVVTWSAPIAHGPHSCYTAFSFPACTMASWGISHDPLTGREDLGLIYGWFCVAHKHHQKVGICNTTTPLWDIPKGPWWREITQWAEPQAVHLAVHFAWKKKWPDCTCNYVPSHGIIH